MAWISLSSSPISSSRGNFTSFLGPKEVLNFKLNLEGPTDEKFFPCADESFITIDVAFIRLKCEKIDEIEIEMKLFRRFRLSTPSQLDHSI